MIYYKSEKYRKDIDGLRAIAVIAVIINHLNKNLLPGGFIGVDIFFIISGFLITSHIYKAQQAGIFSFSLFYKKRINRIFPALSTVIFISLCFGMLLLSPIDLIRLTHSAITSLTGISNIYFWREYGNYFAGNTNEAILLHTWSLGVEEQFYLIWPILLLLINKLLPKFKYKISFLFISIIMAVLFSQFATTLFASASYYLLPTRFFELAMGGLLAINPVKKIQNQYFFILIKSIGFALIFYAFIMINEQSVFPGFNAFIPCLGTVLLIAAGSYGYNSYLLSTKPLYSIGLLSYSMYLWHWPIISYLNYLYISITIPIGIIVVIVTLILSFITWKYIELPFRVTGNKLSFTTVFVRRVIIPIFSMFMVVVITQYWKGFPQRFVPSVQELEKATLVKPDILRKNCHVSNQHYQTEINIQQCTLGIKGLPIDGLLIGDSYANHYTGMIDEIANSEKLHFIDYTMDACPPIFNYTNSLSRTYANRCIARNNIILNLIKNQTYKHIILAANWPKDNEVYPFLKETIEKIINSNAQITIILDNQIIDHAASCPIRKEMFNRASDCTTKKLAIPA